LTRLSHAGIVYTSNGPRPTRQAVARRKLAAKIVALGWIEFEAVLRSFFNVGALRFVADRSPLKRIMCRLDFDWVKCRHIKSSRRGSPLPIELGIILTIKLLNLLYDFLNVL
jgi:hypothetical protein